MTRCARNRPDRVRVSTAVTQYRRARRLRRIARVPWTTLLEGALIARGHWRSLPMRDREKLARLVRKSGGWPGRLSAAERAEARMLIARFDSRGLARELIALRRVGARGRTAWMRGAAQLVRRSQDARPSGRHSRRRFVHRRPGGRGS
jgi:hypothetical protein